MKIKVLKSLLSIAGTVLVNGTGGCVQKAQHGVIGKENTPMYLKAQLDLEVSLAEWFEESKDQNFTRFKVEIHSWNFEGSIYMEKMKKFFPVSYEDEQIIFNYSSIIKLEEEMQKLILWPRQFLNTHQKAPVVVKFMFYMSDFMEATADCFEIEIICHFEPVPQAPYFQFGGTLSEKAALTNNHESNLCFDSYQNISFSTSLLHMAKDMTINFSDITLLSQDAENKVIVLSVYCTNCIVEYDNTIEVFLEQRKTETSCLHSITKQQECFYSGFIFAGILNEINKFLLTLKVRFSRDHNVENFVILLELEVGGSYPVFVKFPIEPALVPKDIICISPQHYVFNLKKSTLALATERVSIYEPMHYQLQRERVKYTFFLNTSFGMFTYKEAAYGADSSKNISYTGSVDDFEQWMESLVLTYPYEKNYLEHPKLIELNPDFLLTENILTFSAVAPDGLACHNHIFIVLEPPMNSKPIFTKFTGATIVTEPCFNLDAEKNEDLYEFSHTLCRRIESVQTKHLFETEYIEVEFEVKDIDLVYPRNDLYTFELTSSSKISFTLFGRPESGKHFIWTKNLDEINEAGASFVIESIISNITLLDIVFSVICSRKPEQITSIELPVMFEAISFGPSLQISVNLKKDMNFMNSSAEVVIHIQSYSTESSLSLLAEEYSLALPEMTNPLLANIRVFPKVCDKNFCQEIKLTGSEVGLSAVLRMILEQSFVNEVFETFIQLDDNQPCTELINLRNRTLCSVPVYMQKAAEQKLYNAIELEKASPGLQHSIESATLTPVGNIVNHLIR
eukprot:augustus_masked-scaffold_5-processed-gene-8.17-mRNA-1 protein AED:1.00 eAED:1.00 QI:0/-1/0/0/-1/1/1/0/793